MADDLLVYFNKQDPSPIQQVKPEEKKKEKTVIVGITNFNLL